MTWTATVQTFVHNSILFAGFDFNCTETDFLCYWFLMNLFETRMHSSRMRTTRLLTISCSAGGELSNPLGCKYPLDADFPGCLDADPTDADPSLEADPLDADLQCRLPNADPPGCRPLVPGWRLPGHVTCDACWKSNPLELLELATFDIDPKLTEFNELCQSWMVVRDTPSLEINTSSDEVIKMKFPSIY